MASEARPAVWATDVNSPSLLGDFATQLGKDVATSGSFLSDYAAFSTAAGLVPCPFVVSGGGEGAESVGTCARVANAVVDLPSWRAMLLACTTINTPVCEIVVHNCTITPQHLLDLAAALDKCGSLQVLQLNYLLLAEESTEAAEASSSPTLNTLLIPFLTTAAAPVNYLSLKGNRLGDAFCTDAAVYAALVSNITLQALSLCDNCISDAGAAEVLRAMRIAVSLRELSLARNACTGECLSSVSALLQGGPAVGDDEALWKNTAKLIGDRKKAVGDLNKKRKKAGFPELSEVAAPTERIAKVEGATIICNRSIASLDFSLCPITREAYALFSDSIKAPTTFPAAAPLAVKVLFRTNKEVESEVIEGEGGSSVVIIV